MKKYYGKFQEVTNKSGADIARRFGVTRQYVTMMASSDKYSNDQRLGGMLVEMLDEAIQEKQNELAELLVLKVNIENELEASE